MFEAGVALAEAGPVHPGRILNENFLIPNQLSANKLALRLGVPPNSITAIINGTRGVSGPMSKLLGRAFNVPESYFADLHTRYQLEIATIEAEKDATARQRLHRADGLAKELGLS